MHGQPLIHVCAKEGLCKLFQYIVQAASNQIITSVLSQLHEHNILLHINDKHSSVMHHTILRAFMRSAKHIMCDNPADPCTAVMGWLCKTNLIQSPL